MAKRPAFTLPEGLELELTDSTLSVRYDGDVKLETTLGRAIGEIHAGGDIELAMTKVSGTLSAGGRLALDAEIDADVLHAREIVLGKKPIKATAISATERIVIGPANLSVDCIIAPIIEIDPKASGRVTVIESRNERGATKIKGGFSLGDYNDMFGNAAEFLAERGLEPLPEVSPEAPQALVPTPLLDEADPEESVDDPLSLSIDDIEEIVEQTKAAPPPAPAAPAVDEEIFGPLREALGRVLGCYEAGNLPPAVSELQLLIEQGDLTALRDNITEVWNGLLSYHQKRGIRPHHQVTHAFNLIHGLIQE